MTPNPKHERQHENDDTDDDLPDCEDHAAKQQELQKSLQSFIPSHLRQWVHPYHGDFCYTPVFHASLVSQLMREGFLPIACADFLLPKLHLQRCVIHPLVEIHTPKSIKKKAKKFDFTLNTAFDAVVKGCRKQHGNHCWLYPALVHAFKKIHTNHSRGVRLYSVEVWNSDTGELAGGELGYTVGSVYTSLTGFTAESSAGSVQLATLGMLLVQHNFTMWDLGMEMSYKRSLGSHCMPRQDFVYFVRSVRDQDIPLPCERRNCRDIINNLPKEDKSNPNASAVPSVQPCKKRAKSTDTKVAG